MVQFEVNYVHMYIHAYIHVCMYIYMNIYVYHHKILDNDLSIYVYMYIYIYVCMYIYIYLYICIWIYHGHISWAVRDTGCLDATSACLFMLRHAPGVLSSQNTQHTWPLSPAAMVERWSNSTWRVTSSFFLSLLWITTGVFRITHARW